MQKGTYGTLASLMKSVLLSTSCRLLMCLVCSDPASALDPSTRLSLIRQSIKPTQPTVAESSLESRIVSSPLPRHVTSLVSVL
ncbi:hypothetical protein IWZ03DRAFT_379741 [Phyllosticta citriasiana]|uniref:Secreted protein n=1 Tax=Phyllosticta citriasiana TaxID=595635 RepID=A0ABR1KIJ1_9PEZI